MQFVNIAQLTLANGSSISTVPCFWVGRPSRCLLARIMISRKASDWFFIIDDCANVMFSLAYSFNFSSFPSLAWSTTSARRYPIAAHPAMAIHDHTMVCFLVLFGMNLYGGVSGLKRFHRSGISFKSMLEKKHSFKTGGPYLCLAL